MERSYITVPRELMLQSKFDWDIDWRSQAASQSNSGFTQTVFNAFPRWYGRPELSLLAGDIPLWRAIRASARGRANIYRVPIIDGIVTSRSLWDDYSGGVELSTGGRLDTGAGFEYSPSMAVVKVSEDGTILPGDSVVSAGAEYITVADDMKTNYVPKIGAIHSVNDFPYIITEVRTLENTLDESVLPGAINLYELKIETPLRKLVATMLSDGYSGGRLELLAYGLFTVDSDTDGAITYGPNYGSKVKFNFVEWLR